MSTQRNNMIKNLGLRYYSGQRPFSLLMHRIKAYKVYKNLKSDELPKSSTKHTMSLSVLVEPHDPLEIDY